MYGRSLSVASIPALIGATITYLRATHVITQTALLWILICVGVALMQYALSFGCTQLYKVKAVPTLAGMTPKDERGWRQRIYLFAVVTALIPGYSGGVLLLLTTPDWRHGVVYCVFWGMGSTAIAMSSPWVWSLIFEKAIPWILSQEQQANSDESPAGGNDDADIRP